jgi:hypothetical protein
MNDTNLTMTFSPRELHISVNMHVRKYANTHTHTSMIYLRLVDVVTQEMQAIILLHYFTAYIQGFTCGNNPPQNKPLQLTQSN